MSANQEQDGNPSLSRAIITSALTPRGQQPRSGLFEASLGAALQPRHQSQALPDMLPEGQEPENGGLFSLAMSEALKPRHNKPTPVDEDGRPVPETSLLRQTTNAALEGVGIDPDSLTPRNILASGAGLLGSAVGLALVRNSRQALAIRSIRQKEGDFRQRVVDRQKLAFIRAEEREKTARVAEKNLQDMINAKTRRNNIGHAVDNAKYYAGKTVRQAGSFLGNAIKSGWNRMTGSNKANPSPTTETFRPGPEDIIS